MISSEDRIFVAGHRGLVGASISRLLRESGYLNLLERSRSDLDLRDANAVDEFFANAQPEYVFLCAAKVGGILANDTYPVDFLVDNLAIQMNVMQSAHRHGVRKLQFLGSSCVYPKLAPQPIREQDLLSSHLEPTNECYAIAKIAGIKMVQAYRKQYNFCGISLMPTNLYGPGDNFELHSSHVVPALIRKLHEAQARGQREVVIWGTGKPRRELLHTDDLAAAAVFLMRHYDDSEIINVGSSADHTIAELAAIVARVTGFTGDFVFDSSKPDGTPRKLIDSSRLRAMGWSPKISLEAGIRQTYQWYLSQTQSRGNQPEMHSDAA